MWKRLSKNVVNTFIRTWGKISKYNRSCQVSSRSHHKMPSI